MSGESTMRNFGFAAALSVGLILVACGGGGDGDPARNGQSAAVSNGSGGSGDGGSSSSGSGRPGGSGSDSTGWGTAPGDSSTPSGGGSSANAGNTIPVVVSSASTVLNYPLVSVTICKPNTIARINCATIDNVLLDTGSFGLRLYASVIPPATLAALPIQTDARSGEQVAACGAFGSGYMWGSLRNADVKLGGEIARSVPIHVVTDPAIASPAARSCKWNTALDRPATLGANGVLGVGVARYDCGTACASTAQGGYYYADTNPATEIAMPLANQVSNPVASFTVNNNGVILEMPAIPSDGAATATGTLTFGVDTQSNNLLTGAGATVFDTDLYGNFTGSYNGASTVPTFTDSGSNALIFQDYTIARSDGFYSPSTELTRSVALSSSNGSAANVTLNIGNASRLLASTNHAFSNLGAYMAQTIDLGLPFFFGKRVYYGIAGTSSPGGATGPYVAFVPK